MLSALHEQLAQQPQEGDQGLPELDLDAAGLADAGGDPGDAFQADAQEFGHHLNAVVDAHTAPIREQVSDLQRTHEAAALAADFPEMQDPDVMQRVFAQTAQLAQVLGAPELAGNFALARTVYMANRAYEIAQAESDGEEHPPAAMLEGGGGAGPAGGGGSAAQAIVGAGRTNPLPFA